MRVIHKLKPQSSAFTLIELVATVLITVSLSTLSYVSLNNTLVNTSTSTSADSLTAEVKSQQLLAIAGKTEGIVGGSSVSKTQAVYFALGTKYFYLFECESPTACVYSESNATNIQKSLGNSLIFSNINLPNNTIIYQPTSGEPYNYSSTQNTLEITNQISNAKVTLQLNSLGVLVAIHTPAPTSLSPAGTTTAGVHSITWDAVAGYTYAIRVDDQSDAVAWTGNCGALGTNTAPNQNDACDNALTTNSYAFNFQLNHTYKIWVHNISSYGWSDASTVTVTAGLAPTPTNTPTLPGNPTPTTEPSPVIAYNFDEGSADWVYDRTGNALHSRFTGTTNPTWTVSGKNTGGLDFPVASNSFTQLTNSVLNLNNYTYDMWFKLNSTTGTQWQNILAISNDSSDRSPGLWINHTTSDCLHIMQNAGNAGNACVGATGDNSTLTANTWYHLAVVKSGTTQTVYINGAVAATATVANPMQNAPNPYLRIGGTYSSGFIIDDFRLYNYARSGAGVISDRDTPVTGTVTPYTPTPTHTPVPPSTSGFTASLTSLVIGGTGTTLTATWSAPTSQKSAEILITTSAHTLPSGCATPVSMSGDASGAVWCRIAQSLTSPFSTTWTPTVAGSYVAVVNVYNNATYAYAPDWSCTGSTWVTTGAGSWRDCGANDTLALTAANPTPTPTNTNTPTPTHTPTNTPTRTPTPIPYAGPYSAPYDAYGGVYGGVPAWDYYNNGYSNGWQFY